MFYDMMGYLYWFDNYYIILLINGIVSYKNIVIKCNNSDIFCSSYCIYVNLRRKYI